MATASNEENIGPETRRILRRVYTYLKKESSKSAVTPVGRLTKLSKLTGLNTNFLISLEKGEAVNISLEATDRSKILKALNQFCTAKRAIPDTLQLFAASNSQPYMDIAGFRKLLFKYDFVWKKLPNCPFAVFERPEVLYERYLFLKAILDTSDTIYFVEEIGYNDEDNTFYDFSASLNNNSKKIIYAISKDEIIFNDNYKSDYTESSFKNWVIQELLPNLQNPSLIIFNNAEHHCEMLPQASDLTIDSLKCEMTDWLDRNRVPYEKDMSKVELFSLIENCTDKYANKYLIDSVILARGHTPLRLPDQLISLTPGKLVSDSIKSQLNLAPFKPDEPVSKAVASLLTAHLGLVRNMVADILKEYKQIFTTDMHVDQVLDQLMAQMDQMNYNLGYEDSDLPSMSEDSDDE